MNRARRGNTVSPATGPGPPPPSLPLRPPSASSLLLPLPDALAWPPFWPDLLKLLANSLMRFRFRKATTPATSSNNATTPRVIQVARPEPWRLGLRTDGPSSWAGWKSKAWPGFWACTGCAIGTAACGAVVIGAAPGCGTTGGGTAGAWIACGAGTEGKRVGGTGVGPRTEVCGGGREAGARRACITVPQYLQRMARLSHSSGIRRDFLQPGQFAITTGWEAIRRP